MIKLYGIPNCDTVKKARKWLEANGIDYQFHDYKKDGVPETALKRWVNELGWEALVNRRGTTWRRLDESCRSDLDKKAAIALMLANPSLIKRPVVEAQKRLLAGFDPDRYRTLTQKN